MSGAYPVPLIKAPEPMIVGLDAMNHWAQFLASTPEWRLAVAVVIGLLIGLERERRKGEGETRGAEGLRTFALVALLGGISGQIHSAPLVIASALFTAGACLYHLFDSCVLMM